MRRAYPLPIIAAAFFLLTAFILPLSSPNHANSVRAQQGMGPGPGLGKPPGGAGSNFVFDTFTDTDNTLLSAHTGETGATWTKHTSYTDTVIILSNRAHKDNASSTTAYYASGTPASTDYTVEGSMIDLSASSRTAAICGWMDTATNSMVCVRRNSTSFVEMFKLINGTFTSLQAPGVTYTQDLERVFTITRSGNNFSATVDGVSFGSPVTVTDAEVSSAGRVGVRLTGAWPAGSTYPINYIKAYP